MDQDRPPDPTEEVIAATLSGGRVWRDAIILVILATIAFFASLHGAQRIDPVVIDPYEAPDVWFCSDTQRVFANMSSRTSNHSRTKVHPLFSLLTFPVVKAETLVFGIKVLDAVRITMAFVAALWISLLFLLLRLVGLHRLESLLFSVLAAVSASAMFWFVVPETFPLGSVSILLAACLVALTQYRKISPVWYTIVSAFTLSFSVTNWMAGILAAFAGFSWRRALQITINAFCIVVFLWGIQKFVFPSAVFFLGDREEETYLLTERSGGPLAVTKAFVFHAIVMPAIQEVERLPLPIMSVQSSRPGSGSVWGTVAIGFWGVLLGLGIWGFLTTKRHPKLRLVIGFTLIGQLLLHILYGAETFNYAAHFGSLLVVLAAFSLLTRARPLALVLAGTLTVFVGVNNGMQFDKATKFIDRQVTPRYVVRRAMGERPHDPWPRSSGHVILAVPGSREDEKAYHEPGGSFSPSVGSFGISIWITDLHGTPLIASDTIPLNLIRQQLTWTRGNDIPGILTESSYYQTRWSPAGPGEWILNFKPYASAETKPMVVVRSVGPAGGPIRSLDWDGHRLLINERWTLTLDPLPRAVYLGEEGPKDWKTARSGLRRWTSDQGWGYARFEQDNGVDWRVAIHDPIVTAAAHTKFVEPRSALEVDLPDKRFITSLDAQVAHLMMGLVDRQTRPGDPTVYPLEWQRDGAYVVAALARAGKLVEAKELSIDLAEKDFFGGFGPEADAPGLAIWALEEVASRLHQPEYDQWLWPHVRRKAQFILDMLSTNRPIHQPVIGPIVPRYLKRDPELSLVADPSRDGLIIGRMDHGRPVLYVNAVSYRGLLDAAALADRVNKSADADLWRTRAAELQRAWGRVWHQQRQGEGAFRKIERALRRALDMTIPTSAPELDNDRTYISGLWPTWVAASDQAAYSRGLEDRWAGRRDMEGQFNGSPAFPYFDIAETHQWLMLGRQDRVWMTLQWFWEHQASPGLYTWWEDGLVDADLFHRWRSVRGWVNPPHVTPHYWAAAEMLSLQLDMLAYLDETGSEPLVVIGAGIPPEWLKQPMSIAKLPTRIGQVDWTWNGWEMNVKIRGCRCKVRLGPVFAPNTRMRVEYVNPR